MMLKHLVSMEWVKENLQDSNLRIIDCRFDLANPNWGHEIYKRGHLPGALFFDLDQDLSSPKQEHGGRHPLPDMKEFVQKLSAAGIDSSVKVVAYDDQAGGMAARLWWMLQYLGHAEAYLMDGGFTQWKEQGYPITTKISTVEERTFVPHLRAELVVTMEEVKQKIGQPGTVMVDSREERRYLGLEEPIDPVAGHVPSAVNYFWMDNVHANKQWKSVEEQQERFKDLPQAEEVIVYCGSGVTSCANFLTLQALGYQNVRLYLGSWSDWCSYPDNEIATKKD